MFGEWAVLRGCSCVQWFMRALLSGPFQGVLW